MISPPLVPIKSLVPVLFSQTDMAYGVNELMAASLRFILDSYWSYWFQIMISPSLPPVITPGVLVQVEIAFTGPVWALIGCFEAVFPFQVIKFPWKVPVISLFPK